MASTDGIGLPARPAGRSDGDLRRFGLVMAGALGALGGLAAWRGKNAAVVLLAGAAVFAVLAVFLPRLLGPAERAWMALARVLSAVMTHVILTIFYFLVITPFGIVMRIAGRDPLRLRPASARESYWEPAEASGPGSRPDKPY
jgi:hypothetical protein